jgi:calcium-dependent protein kinase
MGDKDADKWVVGKTERLDKFYDLGKPIGEPGQFGQAYLVTHKGTKEIRAVKVISKQKFRSEQDRDFHFRQLRDEISILTEMSHPNIIKFFEVFESSGHLYIVMECCRGGELFDRIREQKSGAYSEKDSVGVLKQIISGLKYMHDRKIAHCDLKPDNFLFLTSAADSPLKIIDFGMSKHVQRRKYLTSFRGTPYYVAPEVLEGKYAEHCDIWSFGVVMFVMLFGFPPFHANSDEEIFKKIKAGFENKTKKGYGNWFPAAIPCSEDAKDLIARCLNSDKAVRLNATEVLEHKFFHGGASATPFVATVATNLKEFCANTKFKVQVLSLMTSMLDQDELGSLKRVFHEIDANGDGQITAEELREAFKRQGLQDAAVLSQVDSLMKMADVNGDGVLSYEELVMTSVQRKLQNKEERLWEAFCKFDKDLDGSITASEIAEVLKVTKAEAEVMIKEIDKNGDSTVDYEEFSAMMMAREEQGVSGLAKGIANLSVKST